MDEADTVAERRELMPILKWLNGQFPSKFGSRIEDKTRSLEESRKFAVIAIHVAWSTLPNSAS